MTRLTTLDIPNLHRATIGFDRMFNELERQFANSPNGNGYPPYNIAQINDDEYMISVAVAGFGMDNLDITKDGKILRIEGTAPKGDEDVNYLHKGIGGRNFRREFTLADHVEVVQAGLELGMLNIHLKRELPEELQPKKIAIKDFSGAVHEAIDTADSYKSAIDGKIG
jgi:molecular chaperone IbpA